MKTIRLWFMLLCAIVAVPVMSRPAEVRAEMAHYSRAGCRFSIDPALVTNESGTWNWGRELDALYYVRSWHFRAATPSAGWIYEHFVDSGWNGMHNGKPYGKTYFPDRRSVAIHWKDYMPTQPAVVGRHWIWDPKKRWYYVAKQTWTVDCTTWNYW